MIKKTIAYKDYDGNEREEDFYFNINRAEAVEMQAKVGGGLDAFIRRIVSERDTEKLVGFFKELILMSYGQKSFDGRRFEKSKEITDSFVQTEAYPTLFMELANDADKAAEFVNGIIPHDN